MPVLTKQQKIFIVTQLAEFVGVAEVKRVIKERFKLDLPHQQIGSYDPLTVAGEKQMSPALKELFHERREAFKANIDAIPISHKAVRLAMLQRAAVHFESAGNRTGMAAMIEQAAKEVHETYSPKRDVTLKGNLKHEHEIRDVSDEELMRKLAGYGITLPGLGSNTVIDVPAANQAGVGAPANGAKAA